MILSILSSVFFLYHSFSIKILAWVVTQKTSCDRPLDSATPHPIKDENKKVTNNFYDLF